MLPLHPIPALRHLHRLVFGRWPGRQAVHHPYERIVEIRDDEFCGCDREPPSTYGECCRDRDHSRDRVADAVNFTVHNGSGRRPPKPIIHFLSYQDVIAAITEMLPT